MTTFHYTSRWSEPADPTGDLVIAKEVLDTARQWIAEAEAEGDLELAAQRRQVLAAYEEEYDAMVQMPDSGRYAALDEGFRAIGAGAA